MGFLDWWNEGTNDTDRRNIARYEHRLARARKAGDTEQAYAMECAIKGAQDAIATREKYMSKNHRSRSR